MGEYSDHDCGGPDACSGCSSYRHGVYEDGSGDLEALKIARRKRIELFDKFKAISEVLFELETTLGPPGDDWRRQVYALRVVLGRIGYSKLGKREMNDF